MNRVEYDNRIWHLNENGQLEGWSIVYEENTGVITSAAHYSDGVYDGACMVISGRGLSYFDAMFNKGKYHGKCAKNNIFGDVVVFYYENDVDITDSVKAMVSDYKNPTKEEQLILSIRYGFQFNTFTIDDVRDIIFSNEQEDL